MKENLMITVLFFLLSISFAVKSQDAVAILKKVDEITAQANDITQNVEITLINKNNQQQVRTGYVIQKGSDKRLFKFETPSSYAGVSFLSLPNNVMYLYMPSYGNERRIASSVKNQKFAGTDMSYEDLEAKNYSDKYTPKLISSDANLYLLELTPLDNSTYSKVVLSVKKADFTPTKAEFFDRGSNKIKVSEFEFTKQGSYWYPKTLTVKDLKTNHTTVMKTIEVKFNQNLSDDLFSVRNMMN